MRLENKVAIVVGAGQTPGDTMGNGRAISLLFARQGAKVMLVDHRLDSAQETKTLIDEEGGESIAFEADVKNSDDASRMAQACVETYGRIDILVNVVGIGTGDGGPADVTEDAWKNILDVNLSGTYRTCKSVLPVMEKQESGAILNISSAAAVATVPFVSYKVSKAGVNSLTHAIAMLYAGKGIRANAIMPGLLHTPMAIEAITSMPGMEETKVDELIQARNVAVPLKGGMGTAWDTAFAALFLCSDEAKFVSGVMLPVDGAQLGRIG